MNKPFYTRRKFLLNTGLCAGSLILPGAMRAAIQPLYKKQMRFRLIRHATLLLDTGKYTLLVDPMLSAKEAMDPVGNAANSYRIPMTDLPFGEKELQGMLSATDAVLVTHTHRDHWDAAAQQLIAKDKKIFCQPADEEKIHKQGFTDVTPVQDQLTWNGITIYRTGGRHGTGEIGKLMGTVSGFVVKQEEQSVYIAGDTIWCSEVEEAISKYRPGHIIVNGGGARFLTGDPITMTRNDVAAVADFANTTVTVVHLDTVNHCLEKRADFRNFVQGKGIVKKINIPEDGEWLMI